MGTPWLRMRTGYAQEKKEGKDWLPRFVREKAGQLARVQAEIESLQGKVKAMHQDVAATAMMMDPVTEMVDRTMWERRTKELFDALTALGNARIEVLTLRGDLETYRR